MKSQWFYACGMYSYRWALKAFEHFKFRIRSMCHSSHVLKQIHNSETKAAVADYSKIVGNIHSSTVVVYKALK
jgi:hypothetical protein